MVSSARDDVEMFDPNYDIFENSSPQRPITSHGESAPNDTVDEVLHSNGNIVNFSRKRGVNDGRISYEDGIQHGSKRHRHANWPDKVEPDTAADADADADADEQIMSPGRASKFQEGSMNDRPSQKPPSMFTRYMNDHLKVANEDLMPQWHKDNDKPLPAYPSTSTLPRHMRSPVRQRQSAAPSASTFSLDTQDEELKSGGIFKFGKQFVSAFNPLNMMSKFTSGWRVAKEELVQEAEDAHKRELDERQKRAEQAYAELKLNGKLGAQGSNILTANAPVFTPGYTQAAKNEHQRDSAISMAASARVSSDTSKGSFLLNAEEESPRKSRRHGRTPSFHDLKKVASSISLHRRSASASRSPEKQGPHDFEAGGTARMQRSRSRGNILDVFNGGETFGSLRNSKSRPNLTEDVDEFGTLRARKKQSKLTKRITDLESKLDSAKKELERALAVPPPVPVLPPNFEQRPLPRPEGKRGFVPELPTLFSESLLVPPHAALDAAVADATQTAATNEAPRHGAAYIEASDTSMNDEPLHESNGNSLYLQNNVPLLKGDITSSPPAKENIPSTPERKSKTTQKERSQRPLPDAPITPSDEHEHTFLADPSSPHTGTAEKSSGKKKKSQRRSSGGKPKEKVDRTYRPGQDGEFDDDAEWKEASSAKTPKRKSDEFVKGSPKSPRHSRLPVAAESPNSKHKVTKKSKTKVLRKPVHAPAPAKKDPLPPTPLDIAAAARTSTSLDPVPEEQRLTTHTSFSNVIPAAHGPPLRPTAKATPAVRHSYQLSSSPSLGSPKRKRRVLTPKKGRKSREERSESPLLSSARVSKSRERSVEEGVMVARPNGRDVPPMPRGGRLESKSSFEWPEDVF